MTQMKTALCFVIIYFTPFFAFGSSFKEESLSNLRYYDYNYAQLTSEIQPLAVFAEKSGPCVDGYGICEPARNTLAVKSLSRQISRGVAVLNPAKRVNHTTDSGVDASQHGQSVLYRSKRANRRVL
jgi:hypothetical protein